MKMLSIVAAIVLATSAQAGESNLVSTKNSAVGLYKPTTAVSSITFTNDAGTVVVRLDLETGTVTYPNQTPDEATQLFWKVIMHNWPQVCDDRSKK